MCRELISTIVVLFGFLAGLIRLLLLDGTISAAEWSIAGAMLLWCVIGGLYSMYDNRGRLARRTARETYDAALAHAQQQGLRNALLIAQVCAELAQDETASPCAATAATRAVVGPPQPDHPQPVSASQ